METIEELIDQMVDGGMTPDELRRGIERLDAAPEGWRRCALAFLEAQSWTDAFRSMGTTIGEDPETQADTLSRSITTLSQVPIMPHAVPRRSQIAVALAAGIACIAFSLGWLSHGVRIRSAGERPAPDILAGDPKIPESRPDEASQRNSPIQPLRPGSIAGLPTDRLPTVREVARLRIGTGDLNSAEIPIFAGPGVSQRLASGTAAAGLGA